MSSKHNFLLTCFLSLVWISNAAVVAPRSQPTSTTVVAGASETATAPATTASAELKEVAKQLKPRANQYPITNPFIYEVGADPDTYMGELYGPDTSYLSLSDDSTVVWLATDTRYVYVSGTSTVTAVIATATAAEYNQHIGDVSIIIPQGLADGLRVSGQAAAQACSAVLAKRALEGEDVKELMRRQSTQTLACALRQSQADIADGGLIDSFLSTEVLEPGGNGILALAQNADPMLLQIFARLSTAQIQRALIWFAGFTIVLTALENAALNNIANPQLASTPKLNFPGGKFAAPTSDKKCSGNEALDPYTSFVCDEYECQGGTSGKCAIGSNPLSSGVRGDSDNLQFPNIDCPCYLRMPASPGAQIDNDGYFEYQQAWLGEVDNSAVPGSGQCVPVGDMFPGDTYLRILPLGASIVYGYTTLPSNGNGFREYLRDQLTAAGAPVNYVGEFQSGDFYDNDVEAVGGYRVDQIACELVERALPWLPNVVVLNAGTNDALQNYQVDTFGTRYAGLIDRILSAIPGVTLIASTILPNANPTVQTTSNTINSMIENVVQARIANGEQIILVPMDTALTVADLGTDGTHPTVEGYVKMATAWYTGIQDAYSNCWITPPNPAQGVDDEAANGPGSGPPTTTCDKVPGNAVGPAQIQVGSGESDGIYHHDVAANIVFSFTGLVSGQASSGNYYSATQLFWADLNGDGCDDLIWIGDDINDKGMKYFLNGCFGVGTDGTGTFPPYWTGVTSTLTPDIQCLHRGIQFGDIDGDGIDDFFCINVPGNIWAWKITTDDSGAVVFSTSYGLVFPAYDGCQQDQIRLGDIDGDGRVDILCINPNNGNIRAWRNGGGGEMGPPAYWEPLGYIWTGGTNGDAFGYRFVDINGDGRSDLLWVDNDGAVTTWTNERGSETGNLIPNWNSAGVTHSGINVGVTDRSQVAFARVWDHAEIRTFPDYEAIGADYVVPYDYFYLDSGGHNLTYPKATAYKNGGIGGGSRQKGDGTRYCNMRNKGYDDYVWIAKDGTMTLYGNEQNPPNWKQYGTIFTPGFALMEGVVRKQIHLADLDGDGLCDFLIVSNDNKGSVHMVQNNYIADLDTFDWTDKGIVFDGDCPNSFGDGLYDLAVRFADIDGDGRADYLCLDPNGRTTAWLNTESGWESKGQVKFAEKIGVGYSDRANIRFADINGDGKADYLWMDKFTGRTEAWQNAGPGDPAANAGSSFHWDEKGTVANGNILRGECIHWANIKGEGRADYVYDYPDTNIAWVWYNVCPDSSEPKMTVLPPLGGSPYSVTVGCPAGES